MVQRNREAGRLQFTTDARRPASILGLIQFIAVGTPPDEDGSADLQYVLAVAESIAEHMDRASRSSSTSPLSRSAPATRSQPDPETLARRGVEIPISTSSRTPSSSRKAPRSATS